MSTIAVIQCTNSDLYKSKNPDDYCISSLKKSGMFDTIILAIPKQEKSTVFDELSKIWGVEIFYGSDYNVAERLYDATKKFNPDVVVRVLLKRFYIDLELVHNMIEKIKEGFDYVSLDNNVNYEVAADVTSFNALQRTVNLLKELPNDHISNTYRFTPWNFIEHSEKFNVTIIDYKKSWNKDKIKQIKKKLFRLVESEENHSSKIEDNNPSSRYLFFIKFIGSNDVVMDIACGQVGGTTVLADYAKKVYGIDSNESYISKSKEKFNKKNIEYLHGTDKLLEKFPSAFDKVVSSHTLEHVDNDQLFLERIRDSLRDDGKLILEVPKLFLYPLGEPLYPVHVREYTIFNLEKLLHETGFEIIEKYGGNRNEYVNIKNARNVLLYICKKTLN